MKFSAFAVFCSGFKLLFKINYCCFYKAVPEQKARSTYEYLIDLADDPDVIDVLKFLRQREVVHFQRFGEALRTVEEKLAERKFYMNNMPNSVLGTQNNNGCGCGCDRRDDENNCGCGNNQRDNDCGCNRRR